MKTAGRENPNHGATLPHNRAHGTVGQNRFRSIRGAAKQEKFQPKEVCFFLTSPFIEPRGYLAPQPSTWHGRSEQISLDQGGCEARKIPAEGGVFFLDFSLYRTSQDMGYGVDQMGPRCSDSAFQLAKTEHQLLHVSLCWLDCQPQFVAEPNEKIAVYRRACSDVKFELALQVCLVNHGAVEEPFEHLT